MRESGVDGDHARPCGAGEPVARFGSLRSLLEGREPDAYPAPAERLRFAIRHYRAMVDEWGEQRAVPQMRKHLG